MLGMEISDPQGGIISGITHPCGLNAAFVGDSGTNWSELRNAGMGTPPGSARSHVDWAGLIRRCGPILPMRLSRSV